MKVSDYIVQFLVEKKSKIVFGYIGGAITHLVDSLHTNKNIRFIPTYHEQTAAFAAEGYSRVSGEVGVAIATSGPGATNLITGIADAWFDSIPALFITGQVNTFEYKYNKPIRQQGFQETNILEIVRPITKYAEMLTDPEKIRYVLEKAFHQATEGRPGPVLLDIPMNIQRADIDPLKIRSYHHGIRKQKTFFSSQAIKLLKQAKRPLILAGGGVVKAGACDELLAFSEKTNIPIVVSLMGKGSFPEDHPLFLGMIGSYGNRCANMALANTDLLLAIGTRLDTRQTGTALKSFVRNGKIIHVDIDKNELKQHRLHNRITCHNDAKDFLDFLKNSFEKKSTIEWLSYVNSLKSAFSQEKEVEKAQINHAPYRLMQALNEISTENEVYTVDIGQNQMFSAQMLQIRKNQIFYTSGGLAPMGYALPVAVGIAFATQNKRQITCIVGDGGFHISTQALQLVSQWELPIRIIVLNNFALGMIVQFQDLYFKGQRAGTDFNGGYQVPQISELASAYSLPYCSFTEDDFKDTQGFAKQMVGFKRGIVEIVLKQTTTVVPKLEIKKPIEEISPELDPVEFSKYMIIPPYSKKA